MKTILEGSKQLLLETIDILGDARREIVIVGGWGPFLRHPHEHPGTKDVDILIPTEYNKEQIKQLLLNFLHNGFFLSAKHDFQLCRAYKIGEQNYIYNVDLLHPTTGTIDKAEFVELMDLDVTVDGIKVKVVNSINIKHGDVIYNESLFEEVEVEGRSFNVLDGSGIIVSKINSCHKSKRERDIYDIYLSTQEANTLDKVRHLTNVNPHLNDEMAKYFQELFKLWRIHEANLKEYGVQDSRSFETLSMGFNQTTIPSS